MLSKIIISAMLLCPAAVFAEADTTAAETVALVLDGKSFEPISPYHYSGLLVPYTWRGCKVTDIMAKLKKKKPETITKEPQYQGKERLYGSLVLGTRKNNRFYFAMDISAPDSMLMYFDFNNNGDLSDDGAPLKNSGTRKKGEAGFAAMLEVPWEQLVDNSPYHDKYLVWFFINGVQWANSGFSHSSRTQLLGKITLAGEPYRVILADRAESDNNADLTSNGLHLRYGKEKIEVRYISPKEAREGALIAGKLYRFDIRYSAVSALQLKPTTPGAKP